MINKWQILHQKSHLPMNQPSNRESVSQLATKYVQNNDPIGWFEELYSRAEGDTSQIPWVDLTVNLNLASWLKDNKIEGREQKALIVGYGLGDDAEALSRVGFQATGFDLFFNAIACCQPFPAERRRGLRLTEFHGQKRFPHTSVNYVVSDALKPEPVWREKFDFILESYTLQAIPEPFRQRIMSTIANYLAPKGILLIICRGRNREEDAGVSPPWALTREELAFFERLNLKLVSFEDYFDEESPPVIRFRLQYIKDRG